MSRPTNEGSKQGREARQAAEREKLQKEIAAREKAERIQAEYEDRFRAMQEDMETRQKALVEAQQQIKKLESLLVETQDAKKELEESQNQLKEMMQRLEEDKNLESVQAKEVENLELQKEMDEAHRKHKEATSALIAATTTPKHHHLMEDENEDDETKEFSERDLQVSSDPIEDPVSDRLLLVERNVRLQTQLKSLKEDLAHTRDEGEETTMDRIHKENVKQGRDKYKTLREVRKGNTKRRVDQFENM
ncbi:Moesin/ezrin/radixin -like protein 1like [Caligus rogercresseyi]|uniref:Moesin/ezrin/radixin -like protein 1like n=1 Tax=Caligus rogercresseyi TaxID=217165 RepID=A0A7T8K6U4_CALRO|nr:Moesin/ezrin/radixin -like protein 1like [Caligus rogercresseyi]